MSRNTALLIAFLGIIALARCQSPTPPNPTPDPNFHCPGKEESLHPHPTDCHKFYECSNGDAYLFRCDGNLYFDPSTGMCDWPENVDCKASPTSRMKRPLELSECLGKGNYSCTDNGAWPHEELCEYYYDCWEGAATLCRCIDGYLFDLEWRGCNYPEMVDCGDRINPGTAPTPAPKTTTTAGTGPTQPSDDFVCPKDEGLFPNPKDCSTYYQCNEGYPFLEDCPPDLVFNPRTLYCDYLENVPECNGNPATTTTTPKTSPPTGTPGPTPPGDDFVCPKDEGLFPNPKDCSTYYQCNAGHAFLEDCPPDLVFNPRTENCDYLENVPECNGNPVTTTTTPKPNPPTGSPDPTTELPTSSPPVTGQPPTTAPPGEFTCPGKDGLYPNPADCFTYYVCVAGDSVLIACPDGRASFSGWCSLDYNFARVDFTKTSFLAKAWGLAVHHSTNMIYVAYRENDQITMLDNGL
ncbi:unnamed protein product [Allacma fusca]|uniref:Chitin-binding type-2 domain-containing protein n=1 Tax=Allacma fusca TaxID=39272 RepID=A0A8J2KGR4_9HEXA|nr:unnamed protein product [Allacma fusca]